MQVQHAEVQAKGDTAHKKYQKVVAALEQVLGQLAARNDFLQKDRQLLMNNNELLRKRNQALSSVLQLGGGQSMPSDDILQVLSVQPTERSMFPQPMNINRQEFISQSNPLSCDVSCLGDNEISMSNIGKQPFALALTPGLRRERLQVEVPVSADGCLRAFYLSVLQKRETTEKLLELIDSLKFDPTVVLYEPYPVNEFWSDMLNNFLKIVHQGHFNSQTEVLEYLRSHKLIDYLLIRCLRVRLDFLFSSLDSFESPNPTELFAALANEFSLRLHHVDSQYFFFAREEQDIHSVSASLEISLNNQGQERFYQREEQPCFVIYDREDTLQLPFFIMVDLGLSNYQIQEEPTERHNNSFGQDEERQIAMVGQGDHLDAIANILNGEFKGNARYTQPLSSSRFFLHRAAQPFGQED